MKEYTGQIYHFWVGNISGYIISTNSQCPTSINNKVTNERLKYLGYSSDVGFPKKLNTGRLLINPARSKGEKRQIARKKEKAFKQWDANRPKKKSELVLIQQLKDFNSGKRKHI